VTQLEPSRSPSDGWTTDPWDDPPQLYDFEGERRRGQRNWAKVVVSLVAVVLVVGLLVGGWVGYWFVRQVHPGGGSNERRTFLVGPGDDSESIARRLEAEGFITDQRVFRWYADWKGEFDPVPGSYALRPMDSMGNLLRVLKTPPALTYDRVTFPEGFDLVQFAKRLAEKIPRLSANTFLALAADGSVRSPFSPEGQPSLEGLVFPDTYQIAGNEDEKKVLQRLVKQMELVGTREGLPDAPRKVGVSPYQALVIASLIEREAKLDDERPKIARVIYNRLAAGMPLEIDAALYYRQDPKVPFAQLKALESPYNLYKVVGLPPSPIASPSAASIRAALNPAPVLPQGECPDPKVRCALLYYVLVDPSGRHAFAQTLDEHLANVAIARAAGLVP
jgi:UPF0755 protein